MNGFTPPRQLNRSAAGIDGQRASYVIMTKTLLLVYAVATSLLLSGPVLGQSPAKTEVSQMRRVKRQVLTSTSLPPIRIKFDKSFKYVGSQSFILYDRAQVEQHFFVNADKQKRIKSMYMMQFEGYLPNIKAAYDYPVTKTVNLGGQTYIVNAEGIPNVPAALKQNPQSDITRAASFLESKGYRIGESIMFQRFVRLVDDAKRNEFILLYVEDPGTGAAAETEKVTQEFSGRALKGFRILK